VPGDGHGDAFRHPRADEVPGDRAPEIVEQLPREPGRLACRPPRLAPVANRLPILPVMEDERNIQPASAGAPAQYVAEARREGKEAPGLRLRSLGTQPHDARAGPGRARWGTSGIA
jgi:hypothetical protein